jgi:hypothetical protein
MEKNICPGCNCSVEKCRCISIGEGNETSIGKAKIATSEATEEKREQLFSAHSLGLGIKPWEILGVVPLKITQKQVEDLFKIGG